MSAEQDSIIARALARNDRYLLEFVERDVICPYAKRCRETGKLHRRVMLQTLPDVEEVTDALQLLEAQPQESTEVALVLFPGLTLGFQEFCVFAEQVRTAYAAQTANRPAYFLVVFHPEAPLDASDADKLVSFLRRSPDPTLQLVKASVLEAVRGGSPGGSVYLSPEAIAEALRTPPAIELSVSEKIGINNFETMRRVGLASRQALLTALHGFEPAGT